MRARDSLPPQFPGEAHYAQLHTEALCTEALPLLGAQSVRFSFGRPADPLDGRALCSVVLPCCGVSSHRAIDERTPSSHLTSAFSCLLVLRFCIVIRANFHAALCVVFVEMTPAQRSHTLHGFCTWVRGSERDFTWGRLVTWPPYSGIWFLCVCVFLFLDGGCLPCSAAVRCTVRRGFSCAISLWFIPPKPP